MTQPASRKGPVLQGSPERYGNSRQGVAELLGNLQDSARGVAEWIDGLATGAGAAPAFAHDHRGGIWGRPLGLGHSMPMQRGGLTFVGAQLFKTTFFLNVPDVSTPGGAPPENMSLTGGYQFVDILIYSNTIAGSYALRFEISVWRDSQWTQPQATRIVHAHPGGGPLWTTLEDGLDLPAGLVRITATSEDAIAGWHWTALAVPHR